MARELRIASFISVLALASNAFAQSAAVRSGPILTRDEHGKVTVRATRITHPMTIDGRLDESVYGEVPAITEGDFLQQEPDAGARLTERTEAWVMFDDRHLYIVCRCWDSRPERIVANDMRRDSGNLPQHDNFAVELDTFHDGRSGFLLYVTPVGAQFDSAAVDERPNNDWNPVWDGKATRFEQGWISEMAIPFKSLRYRPGRQQTWGIQLRRKIPGKNEVAFITQLDPAWGPTAIHHMSQAATLMGLEVPPPARNLEIKPYAIAGVTTDLLRVPAVRNEFTQNAGIDIKYGLTEALFADVTYNTDFAQVEADEAQINLTRFGLSFPEKREFFLEGQGIFAFGTGGSGGGTPAGDEAPTIFYSRRIGLSGSRIVPVIGGARVTGKAGDWSVGALSIQTDADALSATRQTNFTVARLKRNILRKSVVGGVLTRRSLSTVASGANSVWGLDTSLAFFQNVYLGGYVAQSQTHTRRGDDFSYRGMFTYTGDRYGLSVDRLVVEPNFNPEVGFMRRENFRRNFAQARFSPRPKNNRLIRKITYQGSGQYTTDNHQRLETREVLATLRLDFHNSDSFGIEYSNAYEFVPTSFLISRGVSIPVGSYDYQTLAFSHTAGQQRSVSGTTSLDFGSFYDGFKKTAAYRGRIKITSRLGVEPNISLNVIRLPQRQFMSTLVGARTTFTVTPRMFAAALVQYSSSSTSVVTNLRFRWEYQPGSEFFVVFTEGRSTLPPRGTDLEGRGLVVKFNRLLRF